MSDAHGHGHDDHSHGHAGQHDHDDHAGHDHGVGHSGAGRSTRKLALVAVINVVGFVAELAGGLLFGSVALLSDAVHMLFDALAYVLAFAAAGIAERSDASGRFSYGLHRLEPLAAFLNGVLLVPMVGFIVWESYQRFLEPVAIGTLPTIGLATAGLVVNAVSVYVLHGDEMNLNEKGAFYHLLGDTGASAAVIVSTAVVEVTGVTVVDPITAVLIASVVLWSALRLVRGSAAIFLHAAPVDQDAVADRLAAVDGVERLLDCHTWQICSELTVATVHVETSVASLAEAERVRETIHDELAALGVHHATVELVSHEGSRDVHLRNHSH